jgi:hypothetical protein
MKISRQPTEDLPNTRASTEPAESRGDGVQGEGNYEAARAFNDAERKFVESGNVPAARAAAPKSGAEQQELIAAEQEGMRRAKQ